MEKSHIELLEENEQLKRDLDDARRALKEKNGGTQDLEAGYEKDIHKPVRNSSPLMSNGSQSVECSGRLAVTDNGHRGEESVICGRYPARR